MSNYAFTHLRHVDLAVPDYQQQLDFYTRQWGLTNVGTDGDVTYLAAEGSPEHYVVRIRKDSDKRLDLCPMEWPTPRVSTVWPSVSL